MFEDKAAFDGYASHPAHMRLLKWLVPLIDALELDFEAVTSENGTHQPSARMS